MSEFDKWWKENGFGEKKWPPGCKETWKAALEWAMTQIHAAYTIPLFNAEKEIAKELKELNDGKV